MRTTVLSLGLLAGLATANINFEWVQPTCKFNAVGPNHCLRGQHCTEQNTYVHQERTKAFPDLSTDAKQTLASLCETRCPRKDRQSFPRTELVAPRTETRFAIPTARCTQAAVAVSMAGYVAVRARMWLVTNLDTVWKYSGTLWYWMLVRLHQQQCAFQREGHCSPTCNWSSPTNRW